MGVTLLIGDVRERLAALPSDHFDCVVTSPPYWGLRDYGTGTWIGGRADCDYRSPTMQAGRKEDRASLAGSVATNSAQLLLAHRSACGLCGAIKVDRQIGLEPTLGEHLAVMVEVFREVRRVLKPSGTCWVNYGDCYATTPNGRSAAETKAAGTDDRTFRDKPFSTIGGTLKPKDLCMLPNRLAIALQDDGWWVRSEIVWGKPNAMPDSSGRFRPATAHEKIFLLTKSDEPCFWVARDTGAISSTPDHDEQCIALTTGELIKRWIGLGHYYNAEEARIGRAGAEDSAGYPGSDGDGVRKRSTRGNVKVKMPDGWDTGPGGHGSHHRDGREKGKTVDKQRGHSRRHDGFNDRWDQMDKAEQQANGRLLRNYEPAPLPVWRMATAAFRDAHFATFPPELVERCLIAGCPSGGTVLDPFGGAGTVGLVGDAMGRAVTLIELNEEYAEIARERIDIGMIKRVEVVKPEATGRAA